MTSNIDRSIIHLIACAHRCPSETRRGYDLSETGIQQCLSFDSSRISKRALVLTSTMRSGLKTASIIFQNRNNIYSTALLDEYHNSISVDTSPSQNNIEQVMSEYPRVNFDAYRIDSVPFECLWEHGIDRAERVKSLLCSIRRKEVVLISHDNFIRNLIHTLKPELIGVDMDYASVISFELEI